ncbi:hypothetical protein, partial [Marivita sp. XM-24bin2]|uniref:hypothetical protein n=1 Tax=Marivita sp. XM-24bin2 TaxID=2133951 RepID=UPI0025C67CB1
YMPRIPLKDLISDDYAPYLKQNLPLALAFALWSAPDAIRSDRLLTGSPFRESHHRQSEIEMSQSPTFSVPTAQCLDFQDD